ncbi:MAG: ATP-binding protein [Bacteroidota bacterium]
MLSRSITSSVLENLTYFPIVGIIGPRQVGKTTLAKSIREQLSIPTIYLDLELDSDLRKLENAETYLTLHQDKCVIIDEIQRMPELFALLRALVDQDRRPARFIILGSASPGLIRQSSETLAGRIAYAELSPFSLLEVSKEVNLRTHWLRGGFPNALLAPKAEFTWTWLNNFIRTFLERDLRELGYDIPSRALRRLLSMLAHINGNLLNISQLARSLGLSASTISRYLDLLEGSFIIHRLQPYYTNIGKRLVKSPKIYIRDTGILHYLLQIQDEEQLLGHIAYGASWEAYVVEQIKRSLPESSEMYFYRTHAGAETDLLLILPTGKKIAVEVKSSNAPKITKGFYQSMEDIKADKGYIIIPEGESYPKSEEIKVVSLSDFLTKDLPEERFRRGK